MLRRKASASGCISQPRRRLFIPFAGVYRECVTTVCHPEPYVADAPQGRLREALGLATLGSVFLSPAGEAMRGFILVCLSATAGCASGTTSIAGSTGPV